MTGSGVGDVLVGRAVERAGLRARLEAARAGAGRVVLLTGPAGIGKSRLAEALADDAVAAGVEVRWGRCPAEEATPPLWPWRRVVALDLDRLADPTTATTPADASAGRLRLTAAVVDALVGQAAAPPLVVVLEDLHWADPLSLDAVQALAAEVRQSRLLVVGTVRDTPGSSVDDALARLVPVPGVDVLPLGPLTTGGVAAWLTAAAGRAVARDVVAEVHARSGGNPLLVRVLAGALGDRSAELDRDGVTALLARSPELRHLVAAALRPLDDDARRVVQVASLLGDELDPPLLAAVADLPVDEAERLLDDAGAAGLLDAVPQRPGRRRFTHALVRDGVASALPPDARSRWHARAAAELERLAVAQPERAAEVAHHWLRAGGGVDQRRRAAAWAHVAAARALPVAPEQALRLLRPLLGEPLPDAERAQVLVGLATAEYLSGDFAAALRDCRAAADAAERSSRPDLLAAAALVLRGVGHPAIAALLLDLCDRALGAGPSGPVPEGALGARLQAQRAMALAELGRHDEARTTAVAALAAAEASGDPEAVLLAAHARADTLDALAEPAERRALADRVASVAPLAGSPTALLWAQVWRLDAAHQAGEHAAVDAELARLQAVVDETPLPLAQWHLLRARAARAAQLGRFAVARAMDADAAALAVRLQEPSLVGMSHAFRLCLARTTGDPADLGADFREGMAAAPDLLIVVACRAESVLMDGDVQQAAVVAGQVVAALPDLPRDGRWLGTLEALLTVVEGTRDASAAAALAQALRPAARFCGGPGSGTVWATGSLQQLVARAAAVAGERDEARRRFTAALEVDVRLGARPSAVLDRLGLAELVDDPATARRLASDAASEARALGMPGPLARADRLLAALAAARPDPLSAREREVAELVAASLSNREVAVRLVLSERTVESHVRSILSKLGLSRRTDVVRWVLERQAAAG